MDKDDGDILTLFLGGLIGILFGTARQNSKDIQAKDIELSKYDPVLTAKRDLFNQRKIEVERYQLDTVIEKLQGSVKEAYTESVGCYLLGMDLAASTMICFALKEYLSVEANSKYGQEKSFKKRLDLLFEEKLLQPAQLKLIDYMKDQRDVQAHEINRLHALDILGSFNVMKEVVEIFSPKPMIAEVNE